MTTPVQQQVIDVFNEECAVVKARLESLPEGMSRDAALDALSRVWSWGDDAIRETIDQPESAVVPDQAPDGDESVGAAITTSQEPPAPPVTSDHVAKKAAPAKRSRKRA